MRHTTLFPQLFVGGTSASSARISGSHAMGHPTTKGRVPRWFPLGGKRWGGEGGIDEPGTRFQDPL